MSKQTLKRVQEYHITNTASFRCCTSTGTEIDCDHCTVTDPIRKRCRVNGFSLAENAILEPELQQMLQTSISQHLSHDQLQLDNCKNAVIFFFLSTSSRFLLSRCIKPNTLCNFMTQIPGCLLGIDLEEQHEPTGNNVFMVNKALFLSGDDNQALQCKQQ